MNRHHLLSATILAAGLLTTGAAQAACADLAGRTIGEAQIVTATEIAAGGAAALPEVQATLKLFEQMGAGGASVATPRFCRVVGHIRPAPESDIRFEVWMPLDGWNQRYWGVGNGGYAGYIAYPDMAKALSRGYATASTNTGHDNGMGSAAALRDPERLNDFAFRAIHLTAVAAKQVIKAHYAQAPSWSYFSGCSNGGRQALLEAQRYPDDYDGILAGAPATITINAKNAWAAAGLAKDPAGALGPAQLALVHKAAVEDCDTADGQADGLISAPLACTVRVDRLACQGAASDQCLTPSQLAAVRRNYASLQADDAQAPGTELGWGFVPVGGLMAATWFNNVVHKDWQTPWTAAGFDAERDLAAMGPSNRLMEADDADLSRFAASGGKLLMYTGMADEAVPVRHTIDYAERVRAKLGAKADNTMAFVMAPGMAHCRPGDGLAFFNDSAGADPALAPERDLAQLLQTWVEKGEAPRLAVIGDATRTRPACVFPKAAKWDGKGNPDAASSYTCTDPER